ncbi:MAG: AMP-binding protein, partial [Chloroflexi bacterium]|nr:AMP-binding protein [Chloroflexota bacterium]
MTSYSVMPFNDQRITLLEYNKRVNRLIHTLLQKDLKKKDVLGVLSWNCIEYMDVFGAADKGGFIIAPFNVRMSKNDIEYLINDSETVALFVGPEFVDIIKEIRPRLHHVKHFISFEKPALGMDTYNKLVLNSPDTEPDIQLDDDDLLFICYTSGTTGIPRGALYTQGRMREIAIGHTIDVPIGDNGKVLDLTPPFHIGRIMSRGYTFFEVATTVIMRTFDPYAVMKTIEQEKITDLSVVPTQLAMLLDLPDFNKFNISSLRRVNYMGSPMPLELLRRGIEIFGPIFCQGYGQTESGPDITFFKEKEHDILNLPDDKGDRLLSCGRPALGVHVRIVDANGNDVGPGEVGEIIARSRHIMIEYWKKPVETSKAIVNGWLHTGDMGRYDEQGYIYLVDRKQDMIISGGENIYPREVEEVLYEHPSVLEC